MLKIESCLKIWIIISKMLFEIAALACIALVLGVSTVFLPSSIVSRHR